MAAEFGIAHLGLAETDVVRLRTVMGMALASGALKHNWRMCAASEADLVIVGADSEAGLAAAVAADGKQRVFAVLAGEADTVPNGCLKLAWPIRLENILSLLSVAGGKVEKNSRNARPVSAPAVPAPSSNQDLIKLATLLRDGGGAPGTIWRVDGISARPLHVSPAEKAFFFGESLVVLRELDPAARLHFVPVPKEELTVLVGKKPIVMLQWLVGLLSGAFGLLPWIDSSRPLRLNRYPEFQMLHHLPAHRRIAAALSRPQHGVEAVAALTEEDLPVVVGFVNAVSLCGYLGSTSDRPQPNRLAAPAPSTSRRSLFASFRKALGIATNA